MWINDVVINVNRCNGLNRVDSWCIILYKHNLCKSGLEVPQEKSEVELLGASFINVHHLSETNPEVADYSNTIIFSLPSSSKEL